MKSFLSRIKNWIYSKLILFFLLLVVLTLINFFWYGITPLWVFVSQGEENYEIKKSILENQIDQIKAEKFNIRTQILGQSENRPSKLIFWKLKEYDAQIHTLKQHLSILQIKENRIKTKLLSLEKPSFIHSLQIFWLSFKKNLFLIGWVLLIVIFVPDVWLSLEKKKKYRGLFSKEQLEGNDLLWFFSGRIEAKSFRKKFLFLLLSTIALSVPAYYLENFEHSAIIWFISLTQFSLILLLGFGIVLTVKRLHDVNRDGKQAWLLFIPLYNVYLLTLLLFKKSNTDQSPITS